VSYRPITAAEYDTVGPQVGNLLASIFKDPKPTIGPLIERGAVHPLLIGAVNDDVVVAVARLNGSSDGSFDLQLDASGGVAPHRRGLLWAAAEHYRPLNLDIGFRVTHHTAYAPFEPPRFEPDLVERADLEAAGFVLGEPQRVIDPRSCWARGTAALSAVPGWEDIPAEQVAKRLRGRSTDVFRRKPGRAAIRITYDHDRDPRLRECASITWLDGKPDPAIANEALVDALAAATELGARYASVHGEVVVSSAIQTKPPGVEIGLWVSERVRYVLPRN
jgi:hypothetical protein